MHTSSSHRMCHWCGIWITSGNVHGLAFEVSTRSCTNKFKCLLHCRAAGCIKPGVTQDHVALLYILLCAVSNTAGEEYRRLTLSDIMAELVSNLNDAGTEGVGDVPLPAPEAEGQAENHQAPQASIPLTSLMWFEEVSNTQMLERLDELKDAFDEWCDAFSHTSTNREAFLPKCEYT